MAAEKGFSERNKFAVEWWTYQLEAWEFLNVLGGYASGCSLYCYQVVIHFVVDTHILLGR